MRDARTPSPALGMLVRPWDSPPSAGPGGGRRGSNGGKSVAVTALSRVSVPTVNGYHASGTPAHPPETAHMSVRKPASDPQVRGPAVGGRGRCWCRAREVSGRGVHQGVRWLHTAHVRPEEKVVGPPGHPSHHAWGRAGSRGQLVLETGVVWWWDCNCCEGSGSVLLSGLLLASEDFPRFERFGEGRAIVLFNIPFLPQASPHGIL